MKPVVLIPGTWANTARNAPQDFWWRPGSAFCHAMHEHGLHPLSFAWDTRLDGVLGDNDEWEEASGILYRQTKDLQPLTAIAHSHGGNVAIYAAALRGLKFARLVTLATPVRSDVPYEMARVYIGLWHHVYGRRDLVQLAGSLLDGHFGFRRSMKYASTNTKLAVGNHGDLHEAEMWDRHGLWQRFFNE